jgi:hypothetical protein
MAMHPRVPRDIDTANGLVTLTFRALASEYGARA